MAEGLSTALRILCLSGFLGVLLDLDHVVSFLVRGRMDRSAHLGGFAVSYVGFLLGLAYLIGLLIKDLVKQWRGMDIF